LVFVRKESVQEGFKVPCSRFPKGLKEIIMNLALLFWVICIGLLWTESSIGADCTAIPEDSISRAECERQQQKLGDKQQDRSYDFTGPTAQKGGDRLTNLFLNDSSPPARKRGAEPLVTIILRSRSTTRVDKTWVEGDRLFYWSRGVRGSYRLADVERVEDLTYTVIKAVCTEKELANKENRQASLKTIREFKYLPKQLATEMWKEVELLGKDATEWCANTQRRYVENRRIFYEARQLARQREEEGGEME
jgi:hypothetical protein